MEFSLQEYLAPPLLQLIEQEYDFTEGVDEHGVNVKTWVNSVSYVRLQSPYSIAANNLDLLIIAHTTESSCLSRRTRTIQLGTYTEAPVLALTPMM